LTRHEQVHTLHVTVSTNDAASPDKLLIETPEATYDQQPSHPALATVDPDNPPWGIFQAILVWIISIAVLIFLQLLAGLPYVIYKTLVLKSTAGLATDPNLIFFSMIGVVPAHIVTLLVVWWVVTNRGRRPFWQTVGWSWPQNFGPWKAVGLAVLLLGVGVLITQSLGGKETQLDQIIASSLKTRFATALLAVVTAPLVEELTFRGVLYPALQRALGMIWAVLLVSALFAGVHLLQYFDNLGVVAVITLLSVSLTLVRAKTGRLLPSFVIHLVFNGIQATILIVQPFVGKSAAEPKAGFLIRTVSKLFI
jgi:membrane protease YdiL (CAAX protease family)